MMILAGWRGAERCCEGLTSPRDSPKLFQPQCPLSSTHTPPCSMGRGEEGKAAALVSWSNVGTQERVPRGVSPGIAAATRSRDSGRAWACWCRGLEGLRQVS